MRNIKYKIIILFTTTFLAFHFWDCASTSPSTTMNVRISQKDICFVSDTLVTAEPDEHAEYDVEPKVIRRIEPIYPPFANQNQIEGDVVVRAWITKNGDIRRAYIVSTTNEIFNKAALRATIGWKFVPAMKDGQKIDVWGIVPFRFRTPLKEDNLLPNQQLKLTK
ncbi:MAG: energy transducer TonB [Bacteroidota bacterium]